MLSRHRAQWSGQHLVDYRYRYSSSGMARGAILDVTVRARRVVTTRVIEAGVMPDETPTIDGVFDAAERALRTADDVRIEYDSTYGFPRHVSVDEDLDTIDDEYAFGASDLRPASS